MTKMAQLETEVAGYRSQGKQKPAGIDPQALVNDPIGTMMRHGIPVEHVTRVAVAHSLGDQAPPELRVLASMGPQISATQNLNSQVEQLSRQVSTLAGAQLSKTKRESFKALSTDKTKYPNLAKAAETDASFFDDDLEGFSGTAEEFASRQESKLSKLKLHTPGPAQSEQPAGSTTTVQSTQDKPAALAGAMNGDVPQLLQKPGFDRDKVKAEVLRKHGCE